MHQQSERKTYNRLFQEAASQRKAANDTQFFWEMVNRNMSGQGIRRPNRNQSEKVLFSKGEESGQPGMIDDNIPVQRSGPQSEEVPVLESFLDLDGRVPPHILKCFELMKFEKPTPIQKHAIPLGLAGLDLMCCAQTVCLCCFHK